MYERIALLFDAERGGGVVMNDYSSFSHQLNGLWEDIILRYGIDIPKFIGNNSINYPCPCCGGRDRAHWRRVDGRIALFCRNCASEKMKSAEDVIMECCNITFYELCNDLSSFVGSIDTNDFKKATLKSKSTSSINLPVSHKQDHEKSVRFLEECVTVPRHDIFNEFGVQPPYDIYAKKNAVFFDIKNENDVTVNVFSVFYNKKTNNIETAFIAGGASYAAWHTIKKCEIRNPDGIAWTDSAIKGIRHWMKTGKEIRITFDTMAIVWACNVGIVNKADELLINDDDFDLLPADWIE